MQADNLKLKFVAHIGEVATQTIRDRRKLVGIDVILVHRLLKNPVQTPEYVLFSEELYQTGGAALTDPVQEISHDLEGIGPVRTYFVDIADVAGSLPACRSPAWLGRLGTDSTSPAAACRTCWASGAGVGSLPLTEPAPRRRSASASSRLVTRSSPAAAAVG